MPRLPRKVPRRHRRPIQSKCTTRASPVLYVPRLPRKRKVDVAKYHAYDVKGRCRHVSRLPGKVWMMVCVSVCVTKLCVTKLYVKHGGWQVVCNKVVCERWWVTKLCVTKLSVKNPPTPADSKGERVRAERLWTQKPSTTTTVVIIIIIIIIIIIRRPRQTQGGVRQGIRRPRPTQGGARKGRRGTALHFPVQEPASQL